MTTGVLSNPRVGTEGNTLLFDVSGGSWAGTITVDPNEITISGTTESYTGTTLGTSSREYDAGYDATFSSGVLTVNMNQVVYADDTALTVVVNAGAITDGTDSNGALSSTSITNNSTKTYQKVNAVYAGAVVNETTAYTIQEIVDTDLYIEALADHASGIAAVHFEVTDGVTPQTFTATAETNSRYRDDVLIDSTTFAENGGGIGVFSSDLINLSLLNDGLLDVTITAYPKYGNAGSVRTDTSKLYNDASNSLVIKEVWADEINGDDATGDGNTKGTAFQSLNKAGDVAAARADSNGHTEILIIRLAAGNYTLARFGSPYFQLDYPLIIDRDPAATKDQVVIRSVTAGGEQMRVRYLQFGEVTLDISNGSTGSNILFSNQESSIYPDVTNPAHLIFKGTKFTHALGREGQLASSSNFWATTYKGNSRVWLLGSSITDMNQDGLISNPQQVYARNTLIQGVSSDMVKQLKLFAGFVAEDNLTPNTYLQGVLVSGAFTAGDTIRDPISGNTATVASYDATNSLIYLTAPAKAADFKQADQVAGGIVNDTQAGAFTYQAVHPDGAQFQNDVGEKNAIVANGWFKNCDGQIIFCEEGSTSPTRGVSFYNIIGEHTDGTANFISQTDSLDDHGFSYLTFPNQDLQINEDAATDVHVKYCVVKSFNVGDRGHPGIAFEGIHKQEVSGFGSISDSLVTVGAAGFVSGLGYQDVYSDIGQDYTPDTGSPLLDRIPAGEQLHSFDIFGYPRLDDGTGAIGAVERVVAAAPDIEDPTLPGNVNAVATGSTSGQLSWTASTDNVAVTGYRVFLDGDEQGTTTNLTFPFTGLDPDTPYIASVSAYDAAGNETAQVVDGFTTEAAPAPAVAAYITAVNIGPSDTQSFTLNTQTNPDQWEGEGGSPILPKP